MENIENEMITINDLQVVPATVFGLDTARLKNEAEVVAEYIRNIGPTGETLQEAKKLLAKARKSTDNIDTLRRDIKREMLSKFENTETELKEIVEIVMNADSELRGKVREFDEEERAKKRTELEGIWWSKKNHYPIIDRVVKFDDWLEPKHLNKTQTIKKSSEEMVEYLEGITSDLELIDKFCKDNADEVKVEYAKDFDVNKATERVEQRKQLERKMKEETANKVVVEVEDEEKYFNFVVKGEVNRTKVIALLIQHKIDFTEGK